LSGNLCRRRKINNEEETFFWTALWDPKQERGRLREGLISTSRMALIGFGMDTI
jgi:hypothetical protein